MSGWRSTMSSACEPLSASITVNCNSLSIAAVTARTPASSSTSRIVRSRPETSAASVSLVDVSGLSHSVAARQIQPHARAAIRRALDLDVPARLLHEAVHHAQAEPGAVPEMLGREERLDRALQHFGRHADAGIGHRQQHEIARWNIVVLAARSHVARLDGQRAAFGHRIASVHGKIDQRGLDLRRIREHVPQRSARP